MPEQRGFNIETFRSHRSNIGHLMTHDYHVVIPYPVGLIREPNMLETERMIELTCESVNFPAAGAVTYMNQRYSYGAPERNPTIPKFSPLQCMFICDAAANLHKFFHEWLQICVNYEFINSIYSGTTTIANHPALPYEIGYKSEYAVDFYLHIYYQDGTPVRTMRFRDAFPIEVADIQLGWARQNEYIKLPVLFSFTDMCDVEP